MAFMLNLTDEMQSKIACILQRRSIGRYNVRHKPVFTEVVPSKICSNMVRGISFIFIGTVTLYMASLVRVNFLGKNSRYFIKRRVSIIKRNLELCFPNKSKKEIDDLVTENLKSLGIALFETGIAWFWSDTKVKKLFQVKGMSNYLDAVLKIKV